MLKHRPVRQDIHIRGILPERTDDQILVGGFNPSEKKLVRLDHFPNFRGENKKYLEPPPRIKFLNSELTAGAW